MRRPLSLAAALLVVAACSQPVDLDEPGGGTVVESPTQDAASVEASADPSPSGSPEEPRATLDDVTLTLEEVATGLDSPVLVTAPEGDPRRFILEQGGRVRMLSDGELSTYLDLSERVTSGGERGLLGLAFHPEFAENGRLFVHYSGQDGRTVLAEVHAPDPAGPTADAGTLEVLLELEQPASNHNGGTVTFGPDGMLYLGLGDGGGADDRFGNGQRPDTLYGTILRLDVDGSGDGGGGYAVPADNPFADGADGAPEVWLYGLRNPWRFAFDADRIYIGDVGQNAIEEVDVLGADVGGANLGWPILEGTECFATTPCDADGTVLPVLEYRHADTGGCAIIGGEVYAGEVEPLRGHWFYGDLCAGFVRSLAVTEDGDLVERDWTPQVGTIEGMSSFGRDGQGRLYVTTQGGRVLRLAATVDGEG